MDCTMQRIQCILMYIGDIGQGSWSCFRNHAKFVARYKGPNPPPLPPNAHLSRTEITTIEYTLVHWLVCEGKCRQIYITVNALY